MWQRLYYLTNENESRCKTPEAEEQAAGSVSNVRGASACVDWLTTTEKIGSWCCVRRNRGSLNTNKISGEMVGSLEELEP